MAFSNDFSMGLPAQGYIIYRDSAPDLGFDPTAPLAFFPPKDSDELFDALRIKYPLTKTHSERMRDAIIEFLLDERAAELSPVVDPDLVNASPWQQSWPSMSSTATSSSVLSSPDMPDLATPSFANSPVQSSARHTSSAHSVAASNEASPPHLEQMTGVFSVSADNQPKQRVRRKMTEAEKVEYRKRRIVKACDKCAKRKRKCHHNQSEMEHLVNKSNKVSKARVSNASKQELASFEAGASGPQSMFTLDMITDDMFANDMPLFDDISSFIDDSLFEEPLYQYSWGAFNNHDEMTGKSARVPHAPRDDLFSSSQSPSSISQDLWASSSDDADTRLSELWKARPRGRLSSGIHQFDLTGGYVGGNKTLHLDQRDDASQTLPHRSPLTSQVRPDQAPFADDGKLNLQSTKQRDPPAEDYRHIRAENSLAAPGEPQVRSHDKPSSSAEPNSAQACSTSITDRTQFYEGIDPRRSAPLSREELDKDCGSRSHLQAGSDPGRAATRLSRGHTFVSSSAQEPAEDSTSLFDAFAKRSLPTELFGPRHRALSHRALRSQALSRQCILQSPAEHLHTRLQRDIGHVVPLTQDVSRTERKANTSSSANGGAYLRLDGAYRVDSSLMFKDLLATTNIIRDRSGETTAATDNSCDVKDISRTKRDALMVHQERLSDHKRYRDHHGRSTLASLVAVLLCVYYPQTMFLCFLALCAPISSDKIVGFNPSSTKPVQCSAKNSSWLGLRGLSNLPRRDIGVSTLFEWSRMAVEV